MSTHRDFGKQKKREVPAWLRNTANWLLKAGKVSMYIIKWPLLVALPILVFMLVAWWSLISALSGEVQIVPDLRGKTLDEARFALSSRSLKIAVSETKKNSQEVPRDLVLESNPPAGAEIKRGRTVRITLSDWMAILFVPDLLGKSFQEATMLAEQKGLTVQKTNFAYSDEVPEGCVIGQDPEPYTPLLSEKDTGDRPIPRHLKTIKLLISSGPFPRLILVPDMEGQPLLPVLRALRDAGLQVIVRRRGDNRDISTSDPFELRRLIIYRQWPDAGSFVNMSNPEPIILRVDWSLQ